MLQLFLEMYTEISESKIGFTQFKINTSINLKRKKKINYAIIMK